MRLLITLILGVASLALPAQTPYFQQDVTYDIRVKLDDQKHELTGVEKMTYLNNSPDTLQKLLFHIWPNAYKNRKSAFAQQKLRDGSTSFWDAPDSARGFIDGLDFKIDGKTAIWAEYQGNPDIIEITLGEALLPGKMLRLETPFRVKIPKSYSRLGHVGQQYQITQWYPKPAVYDRDGWHPMPYLDQGEFYSEFGTFDVHIDVPKNYVVGATGDLQNNPEEEAWLEKREELSRKLLEIEVKEAQFEKQFPDSERKTLHFHQEKVHDFAWFCDKNYYVTTDYVQLPHDPSRRVKTVAMFTNMDRKYWKNANEYLNKSVYYYSLWNGDYPYSHATAVDGALSAGAGMEYPNITVVGAGGSASALEGVIMHEVGHNWFYGMLGSNERVHPWMDEGLNTYMEGRYINELHQGKMEGLPVELQKFIDFELTHSSMGRAGLDLQQGAGKDQPIEAHSIDLAPVNYGVITYMKTGLAFEYLEEFLGEEVIIKCFQAYFEKWKYKHPQPADVQAVFEATSGQDLEWFFGPYLNGVEKVDFEVKSIKKGKITLKNNSGIKLPVSIAYLDKEGNTLKKEVSLPFADEYETDLPDIAFHAVMLNPEHHVPEFNELNNRYRAKGILRKARPLELKFGYTYPDGDHLTVNFVPVLGYNYSDGFMAGVLFHHHFFPKKKFELYAMPMFAFKSNRVTGSTGFTKRWYPNSTFYRIELQTVASSFAELYRLKPSLEFYLRPKTEKSLFRHEFSVMAHFVYSDTDRWVLAQPEAFPGFVEGRWSTKFNKTITKVDVDGAVVVGLEDMVGKIEVSGKIRQRFLQSQTFSARIFGGYMTDGPFNTTAMMSFRPEGSFDPFGENILLARNEMGLNPNNQLFLARQTLDNQGAFRSLTGRYFFRGLAALNLETTLGLKTFRGFTNFGIGGDYFNSGSSFIWDAGISAGILNQSIRFNFPLAGTAFGGEMVGSWTDFKENITFTFEPMKLLGLINLPGG